MATHASVLAWRIPWREEPGGLQSTGSQSRARLGGQAQCSTAKGKLTAAVTLGVPTVVREGWEGSRGQKTGSHGDFPVPVLSP